MSLLSCFTDGDGDGCDVDVEKYLQRRKRLLCHFNDHDGFDPNSDDDLSPPSKQLRLLFPILAWRIEVGGLLILFGTSCMCLVPTLIAGDFIGNFADGSVCLMNHSAPFV